MSKPKRATAGPGTATPTATVERKTKQQPSKPSAGQPSAPPAKRWPFVVGIVAPLALFLFIYGMRLNRVVGHPYVDDGYYVLLAKALATGQGFTLINTPSPGIMPIYPPAFPFLLSLVWRIAPQFPQNVWLLKLVSIAAMLGVGVAAYVYCARLRRLPRNIALGIAIAAFINPGLVHYATSTVMSECVYTFIQLAAIIVIERCVQVREGAAWRWALIGAALASLAFLTRSFGVTLLAAAVVYLLKERMLRAAAVFTLTTAVLIGPWLLYARAHAPSEAQRAEQKGYITSGYATQFWQRSAGEEASGRITPGELPGRTARNVGDIVGQKFGAVLVARLLQAFGAAGFGVLSVLLSLLALVGFVFVVRVRMTVAELYTLFSLGMIALWPWDPVRFLLPLVPFLLFYLMMGARAIAAWRARGVASPGWAMAVVLVWVVAAINIVGNLEYIGRLDEERVRGRDEEARFAELEAMMQWAQTTLPADARLASLNPPLVHLYTNRKTVSAQEPLQSWETWKRLGVQYVALTSPYGVPERDTAGQRINVIYQSRRDPHVRVIDLGPAETRATWPDVPARKAGQ